MAEEYNGWPNYETWLVALWIDNDQGLQAQAAETARACCNLTADDLDPQGYLVAHYARPGNVEKGQATRMADTLKEWVENMQPSTASMISDLVGAALSRVEWRNVAEHYMDVAREAIAQTGGPHV